MVEKSYEGFVVDKNPDTIIRGVGWAFFITSCWLAYMLLPGLFTSNTFMKASAVQYDTPDKTLFIGMIIIIVNHLAWMLGAFIVSGYFFQKRRVGVYLAGVLVLVGFWRFPFIPLNTAGKVLLLGVWLIGSGLVAMYWRILD